MWSRAEAVEVSPQQRQELVKLAQGRNVAQKIALRARIILGASEGKADHRLAQELNVSRPTVALWRKRFRTAGVRGLLRDATRPGRRKKLSTERITAVVEATLKTKPRDATHWSVRTMARAQRISPYMVYRIWQAHGLKPHRVESFKLSTDPEFVAKVRDVAGLYLDPPDKALLLCVDEKSQIQTLDRTQRPAGDSYRLLYGAPQSSRVHSLLRENRPRDAQATGHPSGAGQLRHPQTSQGQGVVYRPSALSSALYPDQLLLAQSRRALVRGNHQKANPARYLPQCSRTNQGYQ